MAVAGVKKGVVIRAAPRGNLPTFVMDTARVWIDLA
jgi:hypothetical protein